MVSFAQFTYTIKYCQLSTFCRNASRFFPNITWKITFGDTTVTSKDIMYAIEKLAPNRDDDIVIFDTGRIWSQFSFVHTIPLVNWDNITIDTDYTELANQLAKNYYDSDGEIAVMREISSFPWHHVDQVMKQIHQIMPLHGYFYSPSTFKIYIRKFGTYRMMQLTKNTYTNCVDQITFDLDDGFSDFAPSEMHDLFKRGLL